MPSYTDWRPLQEVLDPSLMRVECLDGMLNICLSRIVIIIIYITQEKDHSNPYVS